MKANKIFALALAIMMVLALAAPAFAAEGDIVLTISSKGKGNTYYAYQIFKGVASGDILSDVEWGADITDDGAALIAALKTAGEAEGDNYFSAANMTAAQVAEALGKTTLTDEKIAEIIGGVMTSTADANKFSDTTDTDSPYKYTYTAPGAGYYFIKQTVAGSPDVNATAALLKVIGNQTVTPKENVVPIVNKTLDDAQDAGKKASAGAVGDKKSYTITITIPELTDYNTYKLVAKDIMSPGLALVEGTIVVTYSKQIADGDDLWERTLPFAGNGFELVFDDVIGFLEKGDVVTIKYRAEITQAAAVGSTLDNNFELVYDRDPDTDGGGSAKPEVTPSVYTTDLVVIKQDGEGNALAGATFRLLKNIGTKPQPVWEDAGTVPASETADKNIATFNGLGAGLYKLEEFTVPAGYNKMADVEFTVTFDAAEKKFAVTVDDNKIEANPAGTLLTATVKNVKGATLPETGGIGTTIFTILGIVLMAGAAVVLITKKKMSGK
ncbi:isopeptide-forming domain-containing fimbrial protein [Eubacteriales bacterium OttesenSCG-928-K08]|nr:isopeptide-forming domain-containing fimbrial protein [Eubacteriales bacterium OttesenSCG-928-K08]